MANLTSFDPYTQSVTFVMANGTPFNVTMEDIDSFVLYSVQICINYAAQLGASVVLLIVLLLLTKPDKRRSPIFIINVLTLSINFIRNILYCLYFTGPFNEIYAYFGQDYSRVHPGDYATSVTGSVLALLMLVLVEVSLILQVRVVCVTIRKIYREGIFVLSVLVALLAIAFRFALCVENSISIVKLETMTALDKLDSAATITTSVSICWFCLVFVTKLGIALQARRKLGLGQFGPMQIIFIMGCQTLIIPAIFSILQYVVKNPAMSSNVLTLVAIFLPLSSLWASANISSRIQPTLGAEIRHKMAGGSGRTGSSSGPFIPGKPSAPVSPTNSDTTRDSKNSMLARGHHHYIDTDLEAQGLGEK